MRRLLKFLHTLGAAGFAGGMAALAVVVVLAPATIGTTGYRPLIDAAATIAAWIIVPSMILAVVSGLLAMAANPVFYDLGWVWVKAASGVLLLEGGLHLLGPLQEEAKRTAGVVGRSPAASSTAELLTAEANTLWVLLAVAAINIAFGIWRPRLSRLAV